MDNLSNCVTTVKPSYAAMSIECFLRARTPVFLWGPPGIGKSDVVRQVAKRAGRTVIDIRAVQFDPVDLRGIPARDKRGYTVWSIPDLLPREDRDGPEGILFLDELTSASLSMQAACYQLVLDRKLGDYVLPDGWDIIGAGNRETDRGVTIRMPTPLANRFGHLDVATDLKDWCRWANKKGIEPEIIAFLRFRPELLHAFDPRSGEKAFPTPRSWEMTSRTFAADVPLAVQMPVYAGLVGQAAAIELTGFLRIWATLPSIDGILMNPQTAPVPTESSALFAVTAALAKRADDANFPRVWTYAKRLPPEYTVLLMSDATRRNSALEQTKSFVEFGSEYADVL
jgi:hypothetical protein